MIEGVTNMGMWQCPDIGVWQSGCYSIIPGCGKLSSKPLVTGELESTSGLTGLLQSKPKVTGEFSTFRCED